VTGLHAVDRQLVFVERLLADEGEHPESRQVAMSLLRDVEEALARWASDVDSRAFAGRLLGVRAELSGHLLAASTLEEIGPPATGGARLLRRAVETTRTGLRAVASPDHPAGHSLASLNG
jgi:hypothetical protein